MYSCSSKNVLYAKKIPEPGHLLTKPGDAVFHPRTSLFATPNPRDVCQTETFSGIPAPGSSYSPRLPIVSDSGEYLMDIAALVPGYGGGSATDFNRLPCPAKNGYYK